MTPEYCTQKTNYIFKKLSFIRDERGFHNSPTLCSRANSVRMHWKVLLRSAHVQEKV